MSGLDKAALDSYLTKEPDDYGFSNWCEAVYDEFRMDFDFNWLDGDEGTKILEELFNNEFTVKEAAEEINQRRA